MKQLLNILSFILLPLLLNSCLEESSLEQGVIGAGKPVFEDESLDSVSVTASTIEVTVNLLKANGYEIIERGFCYGAPSSSSYLPTIEDDKRFELEDVGVGSYTLKLEGLESNTVYYIRAYATNKLGTEYSSSVLKVTTKDGLGSVWTLMPDSVRSVKAKTGGRIDDLGEGEVLMRGVYYSKDEDFLTKDSVLSPVDSINVYMCWIHDLEPKTRYFVKAFVRNTYATFMGNVETFDTGDGLPRFGEARYENVGFTNVTLVSSVSNGGDETVEIEERGFCWAKDRTPTISDNTIECEGSFGRFEVEVSNLEPKTRYYACAYAKNQYGIVYSDAVDFYTKDDIPTVRTDTVINLQNGSVEVRGTVIDEGRSNITDVGICYSTTNQDPSLSDIKLSLSASSVDEFSKFNGSIDGLTGGHTYYIRVYATNEVGTSYGDVKEFDTPPVFKTGLREFPGGSRMQNSTAYFVIDNELYLLGGDAGAKNTDELWVYNILSNTWTPRHSFDGGAAKWQAGVSFGKAAFVFGGFDEGEEKSGLYEYDPRNNQWKNRNDLIGPDTLSLYMAVGFANNSGIFYVGGRGDTVENRVWNYAIDGGVWTQKTDFPIKQYGGIAVVVDGVAYVGMGMDDAGVCNRTLWTTSDGASTWEMKTLCDKNEGGILAGVAVRNSQKIYVIDEGYYILEYNITMDIWTRKSQLPEDYRRINCMYEIGGKIYIGLGLSNSLIVYDPLWDN